MHSPDIRVGNCLDVLKDMPAESVHCVITSPPYWGLRAYKGDVGMIGLEPTLEEHIERLVEVFREVRRVLRKDGTLWLNYGDAYATAGTRGYNGGSFTVSKGREVGYIATPIGFKQKDLMMMPARVALALQADGWWLRSEIVWHKPNPMPESVTDRPTSAHEKVFLLSKAPRYFYDAEAVRTGNQKHRKHGITIREHGLIEDGKPETEQYTIGSNLRNVWQIATAPYAEAHFATFPPALVEPCIKAGTSQKGVCVQCGAPWVRQVKKELINKRNRKPVVVSKDVDKGQETQSQSSNRNRDGHLPEAVNSFQTIGWSPPCSCNDYPMGMDITPATVLDPFGGAGTVGLVAQRSGRKSILIEISDQYADMARQRCEKYLPLTHKPNHQDPNDFQLQLMEH